MDDDGTRAQPRPRRARTPAGQAAPPGLPLRVGTRASPLALVQTRAFLALLTKFCPVLRGMDVFQEHAIRTTGDATQATGERLADIGGKGLFAKEIHEALLDRRIDFAVHSLKDLETELPPGIVLACTLPREDPRDVLILGPGLRAMPTADDPYAALPHGAVIGSQLGPAPGAAAARPARPAGRATSAATCMSRLDKVRRGDYAASLLAMAGLRRLGLEHEADVRDRRRRDGAGGLPGHRRHHRARGGRASCTSCWPPSPTRTPNCAAAAERALLGALDGSCHTPIGAYARLLPGGRMRLTGLVARADGSFLLRADGGVPAGRRGAGRRRAGRRICGGTARGDMFA